MKTKTNARIFAWLLSICLIAGILPAMPASYAQAADGDVITYNFKNLGTGSVNFFTTGGTFYDYDANTGTGTGTLDPKFSNFDHVADGEGEWKYFSHSYSHKQVNHFLQSSTYGLMIRTNGGNMVDGYANYQFLIKFDGNGDFSVDANVGYWDSCSNNAKLSLIPCDEKGENQGDTIELGTIDYRKCSASSGVWNVPTHIGKVSSLRKGYYILNIGCGYETSISTNAYHATILGSLSFTPLSDDNKVFIDNGAYITKNADDTYNVTFLSAIDSLNYQGVGFKVSTGVNTKSAVAQDMGDDVVNVYSSVVVNSTAKGDETVTAHESFGLEKGYVFFDSIENITAGSIVSFQPYAIDLEGNEILGKVFTAQIN